MVDIVKRYTCDACKKTVCCADGGNVPKWTVETEVGDLMSILLKCLGELQKVVY